MDMPQDTEGVWMLRLDRPKPRAWPDDWLPISRRLADHALHQMTQAEIADEEKQ